MISLDADNNAPIVFDNEKLARVIDSKRHVREDGTVRQSLFVPYRWTELSVNRHRDATDKELWELARQVCDNKSKPLIGMANLVAGDCRKLKPLIVRATPIIDEPCNPNHADIAGFPSAKEDQKALAIELAKDSSICVREK